jgi:hypothetical protein
LGASTPEAEVAGKFGGGATVLTVLSVLRTG